MNTNDIKIVLKVCETGSLAKAANLLFLTPQATSVAVKRVETELGVDLFVRAAGGMSMTDYGRDFQGKGGPSDGRNAGAEGTVPSGYP